MHYLVTVTKVGEVEIEAKDEAEALLFAAAQESEALIETTLSFQIQPQNQD